MHITNSSPVWRANESVPSANCLIQLCADSKINCMQTTAFITLMWQNDNAQSISLLKSTAKNVMSTAVATSPLTQN